MTPEVGRPGELSGMTPEVGRPRVLTYEARWLSLLAGHAEQVPVPVSVIVAAGLATAAVAATLAEAPAPSVLVAVVTVPFALYAALAAPRFAVPVALTAAIAGVAVVIYWIYTLISLLSKGG